MAKAKTAGSKNNIALREKAREHTHNGRKIKEVKLISERYSFMAAEYEDSGDLVLGPNNQPMPWSIAASSN